jgi:[ribosomal protein S5]-alanine N-acetyltransferase
MVLHGTCCVLRPLRVSDAAAIARHANNINIARHLRDRFPHPYHEQHARDFIAAVSEGENAGTTLAIEVDGEAAGAIGFIKGSDVERYAAEVGYWLSETHWGRGIVTEALILLTAEIFARRELLRLFALPFADNAPSVRVLEKAGYTREGVLRASAVKYGRPRDQILYARINERWEGRGASH